MQQHVQHIPVLWNKLRGHNPGAVVKYPDFVQRVEAVVQELQARTSKRRDSTTIIFTAKSCWAALAKLLADPERMSSVGGPVEVSASGLKNLARAKVLNLSARKVAKIELPTPVEQPNSHMLNRAVKDIERWAQGNAGMQSKATEIVVQNNYCHPYRGYCTCC